MNIYFAGSIRGGREDAELYAEIINFLRSFGKVLTEHVGDVKLTHVGDEHITDRSIHNRDMDWLLSADIVVAEVSVVSMGVGYEIGRAVSAGKNVICLYRQKPDRVLSAMISGCPDVCLINYKSINEVKEKITRTFKGLPAINKHYGSI